LHHLCKGEGKKHRVQRIDSGSGGPIYYQFDQWAAERPLQHGVFTRLGGLSRAPFDTLNVGGMVGDDPVAVQGNMARIYEALGVDGERACTVWQVHSADAIIVSHRAPDRFWLARADGMVTDRPGVALTMRFADCTPILFYDPRHHAIGMAHAGWRGTVGEVAASTLRAMQHAYNTDPADVQAAIGPAIGPDRYQVGPEVVEAAQKAFGTLEGIVRYATDGSAYLNLWEANAFCLERAGLRRENIEISGVCTAANTHEFYSHRAEGGKTGRFCAVIALRER
jgi:YfiH family protein